MNETLVRGDVVRIHLPGTPFDGHVTELLKPVTSREDHDPKPLLVHDPDFDLSGWWRTSARRYVHPLWCELVRHGPQR